MVAVIDAAIGKYEFYRNVVQGLLNQYLSDSRRMIQKFKSSSSPASNLYPNEVCRIQ